MDGTINRPSDANVSFKHHGPSICSPVAAMGDPLENVVDRDIIQLDTIRFFMHVAVALIHSNRSFMHASV